jgi:hypothetical protein
MPHFNFAPTQIKSDGDEQKKIKFWRNVGFREKTERLTFSSVDGTKFFPDYLIRPSFVRMDGRLACAHTYVQRSLDGRVTGLGEFSTFGRLLNKKLV